MTGFSRIRITMLAVVLAVAGAAWAVFEAPEARALTNCTVSDISIDSEEQAFLTLINNYRAQNGLGALSLSTNLNRSAHWLGLDMGAKSYFSHTDSLGRSPSRRAMDCGYPEAVGENIAAGTIWDTAQEAFTAWRNSSGHNANMLYAAYRQIGIARVYVSGSTYGWYWVTDFGLTNDGTNGGSSSGGSTATATPSPTPAAATGPATISSPSPGSTLSGSSATFSWNAVSGALQYFLYVGTSQGSNNIYGGSTGTSRSVTVSTLPTNGSTVYVRLWTRFASGWQYRDVTYTASQAQATSGTKAAMTSPANGSTLPGSRVTFQWSAAAGAQQYYFYLGTYRGSNNLFSQSMDTSTSLTLSGIPTDGRLLYARLWTRINGSWQYNDYWYRAAP